MTNSTIDHIEKISFDVEKPPFKNYLVFNHIFTGLYKLATEIRQLETQKNEDKKEPILSIDFTSNPLKNLLVCYFDWFCVSITNYARLVGLFELMVKKDWKSKDLQNNASEVSHHCTEYVKRIMPNVLLWRNKMSAHFAATNPRGDTLGTIELSLFSFVTYRKPYYEVGGANWSTKGETSEFERWSVTETYDILTPRFWPNKKLPSLDSPETN